MPEASDDLKEVSVAISSLDATARLKVQVPEGVDKSG